MRKSTLGRKRFQVKITKVLGFTIKVKHGSFGYKKHEAFTEFIAVNEPNHKNTIGCSSNIRKQLKKRNWMYEIEKAETRAFVKAGMLPFKTIIIPKILKTEIIVNRY